MKTYHALQAHNDNARDYVLQRIDDLVTTLQWYRAVLQRVDPRLSESDRRVLMFAVARSLTAYEVEVDQSQGVLLAVSRHFGGRS